MPDKEKLVSGTVTLHVCPMSTDKSISDVNKILTNSGSKSWVMKPKENKVVLKGKDINVEKIVSQLKAAVPQVEVVKIEEDKPPAPPPKVYTTELKIEELCCEDKADKLKSKLKAVEGIEEVTVDIKLKKVTVKSKIESKLVLEAAAKIIAVKLWPTEEKKGGDDKGKEKKDDKPKDKEKEKKDDAKKAAVQHQPGKVYVYNIKDMYCDWRGS